MLKKFDKEYYRRIAYAKKLFRNKRGYEDAVHDTYLMNPVPSFYVFKRLMKTLCNINRKETINIGKDVCLIDFEGKKKTDSTRYRLKTDPEYNKTHLADSAKSALKQRNTVPGYREKRIAATGICEKNRYAKDDAARQKHCDACKQRQRLKRLADPIANTAKNIARSLKRKLINLKKKKKRRAKKVAFPYSKPVS